MTTKTSRQLGLLALLVAVLVYVVVSQQSADVGTAAIGGATSNAAVPVAGDSAAGEPPTGVRLDRLQTLQRTRPAPGRDLFRFRQSPAPAPPSPSVGPPPFETFGTAPAGPPPLAPIPLRYFGILERRTGELVGGFTDVMGRGDVFQAKEGDVIEGRYRVLRLGDDSAELAYLDGRGRQTIRQSGQ